MLIEKKLQYRKYCKFKLRKSWLNVLQAEKGTGKTECIKRFVRRLIKGNPYLRVLVVSPRRTLNRSLANDLEFECYLDFEKRKDELPIMNRLVCSPEHLKYLNLENHYYDVVIIDEVEQTLNHTVTSDTVHDKDLTVNMLSALCCLADTVVLADANILDGTNYFIDEIGKRTFKCENTYKPRKERKDRFELVKSKNNIYHIMKQWISAGDNFVMLSDSRKKTEELKIKALEFGLAESDILLLNRETLKDEAIADKLVNLNNCARDYKLIIYSPSMGTGISVEEANHHFTKALVIMTGKSVNAEGASQMLARFRGLGYYIGHIVKDGKECDDPDHDSKIRNELLNEAAKHDRLLILNGILPFDHKAKRVVKYSSELAIKMLCHNNKSSNRFNTVFRSVLSGEGFTVEDYQGEVKEVKEVKPKKPRPKKEKVDKVDFSNVELLNNAVELCSLNEQGVINDDILRIKDVYICGVLTDKIELKQDCYRYCHKAFALLGASVFDGDIVISDPRKRLDLLTYDDLLDIKPYYEKVLKKKLPKIPLTAIGKIATSIGLNTKREQPRCKVTGKHSKEYYLDTKVIEDWRLSKVNDMGF